MVMGGWKKFGRKLLELLLSSLVVQAGSSFADQVLVPWLDKRLKGKKKKDDQARVIQPATTYNMLFGSYPFATALMAMLCLDPSRVGQFRDAFLTEGGRRIVILTRNGGPRRARHEKVTERLQSHPYYNADWDDPFDPTYAYYEFHVPAQLERQAMQLYQLAGGDEPATVEQRFTMLQRLLQQSELLTAMLDGERGSRQEPEEEPPDPTPDGDGDEDEDEEMVD